jgi:DNA mismatch endonuclease (patch repair protein)
MSVGQTRRYQREEERAKARERQTGRRATEETRQKLAGMIHPFRDTSIEVKVQKFLGTLNSSFKKHQLIGGILPHSYKYHRFDIVMGEDSGVIFEVNGCYWHGCPVCFPKPTLNQRKWIERDLRIREAVEASGRKMVWLWEHDIKNDKFENKILEAMK